jgi:hypothetical protein
MKKWFVLASIACASPTWAADVGVGVAFESDDATIYVPIDFGETFRLEPMLRFSKSKTESDFSSTKSESLEFGTGLFGMHTLADSIRLYYGGRLSYLRTEGEYWNYLPYVPYVASGTDKREGYRIAPTLGFEYLFNKHLSIGGEAAWFYQDIDSDVQGFGDVQATGTDTRLILRLRF